MCDATVIAGASAAGQIISTIGGASAQNAQSAAVARAAKRDYRLRLRDIGVREQEEQAAASVQIEGVQRQTALAIGSTNVSAAEGGVTGSSVTELVNQLRRDQAEATTGILRNRDSMIGQLQREKLAAQSEAARTIAGAPPASPVATALGVAGAGLGLANYYVGSRPVGSTRASYRVNRGTGTQSQP